MLLRLGHHDSKNSLVQVQNTENLAATLALPKYLRDLDETTAAMGEWELYYHNGYPYYHNARTGESVWANEEKGDEALVYPKDDDDSDVSSEASESSDLLDSDEEEELERKFQAMLATPEGQAALHAEVTRAKKILTPEPSGGLFTSLLTAPFRLVYRLLFFRPPPQQSSLPQLPDDSSV